MISMISGPNTETSLLVEDAARGEGQNGGQRGSSGEMERNETIE